jgi:hypothetical protein
MIQHPAILALLVGSLFAGLALVHSAGWAARILVGWDLRSGGEGQLRLERRTYLVSSVLNVVLVFQVMSVFLFIFTAESIHGLFTGAMCAAGTLNADRFGYPALAMKVVNCLLAGIWLVLNHADIQGYDYPLIRVKYALLLALVPSILAGDALQYAYFSGLKADVITSCCGSLFSQEGRGLAAELAGFPRGPTLAALATSMALTFLAGLVFLRKGKGGAWFSLSSTISSLVAGASLISLICLYLYELPTHHCPFCLLKGEYHYIGYLFYGTLLGGGIAGAGVGALAPFRDQPSLAPVLPRIQRTLAGSALLCHLTFLAASLFAVLFSGLHLD